MSTSEFLRIFEQAAEIELGAIQGTETLESVGWWDSMAALVFMATADQHVQVTISGSEIQKCKTVSDLLALLRPPITD